MGPLLNRNKNKEPLIEVSNQNDDDIKITDNFWCNVVDSLYITRKRMKPDEDGKKHENKFNGNIPSETIRQKDLLQKNLEENELKATKLKK